jgi:hypothetical protein
VKRTQHFSQIFVVESLSSGDLHTGRHIYEDLQTFEAAFHFGLSVKYEKAENLQLFWQYIDQIRDEAKSSGHYPILHLDCHGSSDKKGIVLADSSSVSWDDLKPKLIEINRLTRCNLLIVLASCYGGYLSQICYPTDRAPFWGLVGPTGTVSQKDLQQGFSAFYRELLQNLDGDIALDALRQVNPSIKYAFVSAEFFFEYVCANYLNKYSNPQALDKRATEMLCKIETPAKKRNLKRLIKKRNSPSFKKFASKFFMVDLFEDNALRFSVPPKDIYALAERLQEGDIFYLRNLMKPIFHS